MTEETLIGIFATVLAMCLVLGWLFRQVRPTIQGFFWGEQKLDPPLSINLLLSSSFSLNGLLYQTWLGFLIGWWSILIQLVWCGGFLFLIRNAEKFKTLLVSGTMHGVIGSRFGPGAAKAAAGASILGFAILIGWEAVVGATVLKGFGGLNAAAYFVLPLVLVFIASLYTGAGGLRGNALLNLLKNALKVIALVVALIFLIVLVGPSQFFTSEASTIGLNEAVLALGGVALGANLLFSLLWQPVDMSAWQNIAATPQEGRERTLWWSFGAVLFFPGVIGTFLGVGLSSLAGTVGPINDSNILNQLVTVLSDQPVIAGLLIAAFAAAMLSTIDGYALAAAQATTWDVIFPERVKRLLAMGADRVPDQDDLRVILVGRVLVLFLAMAGAAGVLALVLSAGVSLFDLVYAVVVAQMSLVGPILYCLRHPSGPLVRFGCLPIVLGVVAGGICISGRFWTDIDLFTWAPVAAVAASLLATFGISPFKVRPVQAESREVGLDV